MTDSPEPPRNTGCGPGPAVYRSRRSAPPLAQRSSPVPEMRTTQIFGLPPSRARRDALPPSAAGSLHDRREHAPGGWDHACVWAGCRAGGAEDAAMTRVAVNVLVCGVGGCGARYEAEADGS